MYRALHVMLKLRCGGVKDGKRIQTLAKIQNFRLIDVILVVPALTPHKVPISILTDYSYSDLRISHSRF